MLLDTSFLIDRLEGPPEAVEMSTDIDRSGDTIRIPSPALFELRIGARAAVHVDRETAQIEARLGSYEVVPFTAEDARAAGALQENLAGAGKPLGPVDVQIVGVALSRSETLVTGDRKLARLGKGLHAQSYRPP